MHFLVCVRCAVGVNSFSSCAFPSRSRGPWYTREIGEEENLKQQNSDCCLAQFSCSVVSNSLQPQGLQHSRLPYPSPSPRACSNSCPSSRWCHSTNTTSVEPFSSCLRSFPASGSFPMSQFFASGGQGIGVSASASVLPMNIPMNNEVLRWS